MGRLAPVNDETTGLPILMLPPGFRYQTFSWAGSRLGDGHIVPGQADGMGVVRQLGTAITLVRNHEVRGSSGAMGAADASWDVTGGGTTTLVFDTGKEMLTDSWVSLSGTLANCAGGVTPWGTWLSCEEGVLSPAYPRLAVPNRQLLWDTGKSARDHGYVFEVPPEGNARPEPIRGMGQFYHEAAAVDPATGTVYLTEDTLPEAGFYRYVPDVPTQLAAGGRLEMMRVAGGIDMRTGLSLHEKLPVSWVAISDPDQGFTPEYPDGNGVVAQGKAAGGSIFQALEGCTWHQGRIFFTAKLGGAADAGLVYEYDPQEELVWLIYESPGHEFISGPDNIVMSPRGSLVLCEDRTVLDRSAQCIDALTADGNLFRFCRVNPELNASFGGHDLYSTTRNSEWAGATFSADGQWLFCNLYDPGLTVAITGPWQEGLI